MVADSERRCTRCGWKIEHDLGDHQCMACRQWERTMLERSPTVPAIVREGVSVVGDTAHLDLWYPRLDGHPSHIEIGLMDVRANDGLRLHYDFDRDGWVVEQPWYEDVLVSDNTYEQVEHWDEVGFFKAGALRHKNVEPS